MYPFIYPKMYTENRWKSVYSLAAKWKARVDLLANAGSVPTKTKAFYQCCRPAGVHIAGTFAKRFCSLRICPYCHGRHASIAWRLCVRAIKAFPGAQLTIWHWPVENNDVSPQYGHLDRNDEVTFRSDIRDRQSYLREDFVVDSTIGAYGGLYFITVWPLEHREEREDAVGTWKVSRVAVVIHENGWQSLQEPPGGQKRLYGTIDKMELAKALGTCLAYRREWLYGPVDAVAAMLRWSQGWRTMSYFGVLSNRNSNKLR